MAVILDGSQPCLLEAAQLGPYAAQVYCLLWTSAYKDKRYDPNKQQPWSERRDCGGTTHWSHKAISDTLKINKKTLAKAVDLLLSDGLLQIQGYMPSSTGSPHRIYRVTHPTELDSVRHAINVMGNYVDPKGVPRAHKTVCPGEELTETEL